MPQEGAGELILRGAQGIVRINQMEQQAIQRQRAMDKEQEERDRLFKLKVEQFEVTKKTSAEQLKVSMENLKVQQERVKAEKERIEEGKLTRKQAQENYEKDFGLRKSRFDLAVEAQDIQEMRNLFNEDLAERRVVVAEEGLALDKAKASAPQVAEGLSEADRKSRFSQTQQVASAARATRFRQVKGSLPAKHQEILAGASTFAEFEARYARELQALSSLADQAFLDPGDPKREAFDAASKKVAELDGVRKAMSDAGLDRPLTKDEYATAAAPLGIPQERVLRMFNSTSPAASTSLYHGSAKSSSEEVGAAVRVALKLGNVDGLVAEARKSLTDQKVTLTAPVVMDMIDFWVESAGIQNSNESAKFRELVLNKFKGQ